MRAYVALEENYLVDVKSTVSSGVILSDIEIQSRIWSKRVLFIE